MGQSVSAGLARLLALVSALSLPYWILSPLLGLASLVVFYRICRRFGSGAFAAAGTGMLGATAFFLYNAASFFPHALVMLGSLVFVLFALRFLEDAAEWRNALVMGAALGIVGATRHLEAVLIALPFLAALAWRKPAQGRRDAVVWVAVGACPS